ncbi:hypothetical protein GF382_03500 [Candidatus Falkowbacteria bacterium]|nr:hypothetical protein [Candidatus Falkowbacteria bacterium]
MMNKKKKLLSYIAIWSKKRQKAGFSEEKREIAIKKQEYHLRRLLPLLKQDDLGLFLALRSMVAYRSEGEKAIVDRFWELISPGLRNRQNLNFLLHIYSAFSCTYFLSEERLLAGVCSQIGRVLESELSEIKDPSLEILEDYAKQLFIINDPGPCLPLQKKVKEILKGSLGKELISRTEDSFSGDLIYLGFIVRDLVRDKESENDFSAAVA